MKMPLLLLEKDGLVRSNIERDVLNLLEMDGFEGSIEAGLVAYKEKGQNEPTFEVKLDRDHQAPTCSQAGYSNNIKRKSNFSRWLIAHKNIWLRTNQFHKTSLPQLYPCS